MSGIRITYRIVDGRGTPYVHLSLWVNGGFICAPGGISLRVEEAEEFIKRLQAIPDSDYWMYAETAEPMKCEHGHSANGFCYDCWRKEREA